MSLDNPENGDLRIWWIPQVPMKPFHVQVKDVQQAIFLLDTLAQYDIFQFENNIKPDYCNAGGLEVYDPNSDGENNPGWREWENENGEQIDEVMRNLEE